MTAARRLAAILAADVVGYSRLMGEDEAGTARIVRERREAATPIVRSFGGRLVKTTGDGVLLEFPSVVAAVECAIAIQTLMAERNAGSAEGKRILYRIGVNLGDVLIEGDDIIGDGVNIAARLEGIAEPGGILSFRRGLRACAWLGRRGFHRSWREGAQEHCPADAGLRDQTRLGRRGSAPPASAATVRAAAPLDRRIAVYPVGGDPEQEHSSMGSRRA